MTRSLITPEGVDLGVRLADAGTPRRRLPARRRDHRHGGDRRSRSSPCSGWGAWASSGPEPLFIAWIVLIFFLRNVYFIAFEAGRRAATPGKRIVGIRVVSRDGAGLSIDQVIARNLMREIEVLLPLSMLAGARRTRRRRHADHGLRAGLGAAVRLLPALQPRPHAHRRPARRNLGRRGAEARAGRRTCRRRPRCRRALRFSREQLDAYGIAELHKLEEVLRGDNDAALQTVAEAIAAQDRLDRARRAMPAPFLTAYYGDLKAHLERKLLLGNRRADKHAR